MKNTLVLTTADGAVRRINWPLAGHNPPPVYETALAPNPWSSINASYTGRDTRHYRLTGKHDLNVEETEWHYREEI